jgi:peptidoglycan/xylan/chitin deacetylase (PgdA/CDA1 family)
MYHYVRDLLNSRYPKIHALDKKEFQFQIDYLVKNYNILSPDDVMELVLGNGDFPDNGCWLTFDDGYMDHYEVVFPVLEKYGVKGSFFPPVTTTQHIDVLDANKVHFVVASVDDLSILTERLKSLYSLYEVDKITGCSFDVVSSSIDSYHRYDSADVVIFKRLLQRELPSVVRSIICNELFSEFVTSDIGGFSQELYMGLDHLKEMREAGHEIGLHGYDHAWLGYLSDAEQKINIASSLEFFSKNGLCSEQWTICYPHGNYNESTLKIVKELGGSMGVTTVPSPVNVNDYDPLLLPRMNTNDFPKG